LRYAFTSLRNSKVRNAGIALVLAIGIALPTTVFIWTSTGTGLAIDDYFAAHAFQMAIMPNSGENLESSSLLDAQATVKASPFTESADLVPSSVGILIGSFFPSWSQYSMLATNYAFGIKDTRVLLVTSQLTKTWSQEFKWRGTFSLSQGHILVSEGFVEYANQVHNITIDVGSVISIDLLTHIARRPVGSPTDFGRLALSNLTVSAVYDIVSPLSLLRQWFPSMTRKNWDPMSPYGDSVLGIADSVMILQSQAGQQATNIIENSGFFQPVSLVRASADALFAAGAENAGTNLLSLKTQIEEQYPKVFVSGLQEISRFDSEIQTYLQSQVLTVIAFPVLIMSLMLSIFTSETSIARRKGEISALRAKGASFNQVFATFMWESLFLAILGFIIGIGLSFVMAPLLGASVGLFLFDLSIYTRFIENLSVPPLALVIAGVITLYLPGSYLLHVARRIDVSEVGQPTSAPTAEDSEQTGVLRYALGLTGILILLLLMPEIAAPLGFVAVVEILGATLLLFAASYLGSRVMRLVTARLSSGTGFLIGERRLYLTQSLRRRKGQFILLLVILTLTLTTTTMMLIQATSFQATVRNEKQYAIGCDVRVKCDQEPMIFNETILSYPCVTAVTPVIETTAQVGSELFFLEGIDAQSYLHVGYFSSGSFVGENPNSTLTRLSAKSQGIIISEYYSELWNKSVGENIIINFGSVNATVAMSFEIVGLMKSAPGFGMAATHDLVGASLGTQFGFQVGRGGFAFVNLQRLSAMSYINTSDLFLVATAPHSNTTSLINGLSAERNVDVFTLGSFDASASSTNLFLSGMQGLTVIAFFLCAMMGLSALALFLGSAVKEREWEYAVFRAVGGTKSQIVSMVFGEFAGTVVAAIGMSLVLGVIFGYSMTILTFGVSPFSAVVGEVLTFPVTMMLLVLSVDGIAMLAACYFPASRAGAVDPATVLRNL
jgi:ABC-type antimicrobial peptide transport system permease subunit